MPALCPKPLKACAARITLLDECSQPVDVTAVPNSQIAFKDFISISFSPEIETGTEFTQRNACGELCVSSKECDLIKYWNLDMEVCGLQPHLEELLGVTSAFTDLATGTIIGGTGVDSSKNDNQSGNCSNNVMIEVWANNASTDACAEGNDCPYIRYIFSSTTNWVRSGDSAFTNDIISLNLSGIAEATSSFDSPVGLANDPDLTFEFVEQIKNGDGFSYLCTSDLPAVVSCDYVNAG